MVVGRKSRSETDRWWLAALRYPSAECSSGWSVAAAARAMILLLFLPSMGSHHRLLRAAVLRAQRCGQPDGGGPQSGELAAASIHRASLADSGVPEQEEEESSSGGGDAGDGDAEDDEDDEEEDESPGTTLMGPVCFREAELDYALDWPVAIPVGGHLQLTASAGRERLTASRLGQSEPTYLQQAAARGECNKLTCDLEAASTMRPLGGDLRGSSRMSGSNLEVEKEEEAEADECWARNANPNGDSNKSIRPGSSNGAALNGLVAGRARLPLLLLLALLLPLVTQPFGWHLNSNSRHHLPNHDKIAPPLTATRSKATVPVEQFAGHKCR